MLRAQRQQRLRHNDVRRRMHACVRRPLLRRCDFCARDVAPCELRAQRIVHALGRG
jgi:hypothetical protein